MCAAGEGASHKNMIVARLCLDTGGIQFLAAICA